MENNQSTATSPTLHPAVQVMQWADALAQHSEHPDYLTCTFMSPAHRAVARQLVQWMQVSGFDDVRIDVVGNVVGRYRAAAQTSNPSLVVTGSHYDTARNGGRYDGRLGILLPMALVREMAARGERLPYDLEVVGFSEEEGVRFGSTLLGSSAYVGRFDAKALDNKDAQGVSLREAMASDDADVGAATVAQAAADLSRLVHYFEVHIEQGPVLLSRDVPVGVVSAIVGSVHRRVVLTGQAGHAGTTPMGLRRDAVCAAAKIVLFVERRCARDAGLVGTVGQLDVPGGAVNVIPGQCHFSLDIRAVDDRVRDAAVADIEEAITEICTRRNIDVQIDEILRVPATQCAPQWRTVWANAIATIGDSTAGTPVENRALSPDTISTHDVAAGIPVVELPSGAGHDAMMMAQVAPISMLFVRSGNGGVSHHPLETVSEDDVRVAVEVVQRFLRSSATFS